jgi:probable poly-beta-1,6-N-acetyl-D-glucosamine export protein
MRTRIVFFDYFRAIAIIMVVASHAYRPWLIDTFSEKVFINLVVGGTIFFVFISGFFFHYVF